MNVPVSLRNVKPTGWWDDDTGGITINKEAITIHISSRDDEEYKKSKKKRKKSKTKKKKKQEDEVDIEVVEKNDEVVQELQQNINRETQI